MTTPAICTEILALVKYESIDVWQSVVLRVPMYYSVAEFFVCLVNIPILTAMPACMHWQADPLRNFFQKNQ